MLFSTQTDYLTKKLGIEAAVDIIIGAGFPAIDTSLYDLNCGAYGDGRIELAKRLREKADAHGVVFNQAHAPFGGGAENYLNNLIPQFPKTFEFARILGIKNIVVHPVHGIRYQGNEEKLFEDNVKFYQSLVPLAKENGIKIALENMWQYHPITKRIVDDLGADPRELARMYDALNDPEAFTVCLDLGHVAICGREPEHAIKKIGARLGCLHVHDVDYVNDLHTLPGVGRINWDNVCHALADIDYKGDLTLEADHFYTGFDIELAPTVAKFMAEITRNLANKIESYRAK